MAARVSRSHMGRPAGPRVSRAGHYAFDKRIRSVMFDALSDRLNDVFDRLRRHGALSENDVASAMREIRVALLEADVALPVVRDFVNSVREKAIGQDVVRSVTPGQMVVKIVHDHLVEVLGGDSDARRKGDGIDLNATPPVGIMLV